MDDAVTAAIRHLRDLSTSLLRAKNDTHGRTDNHLNNALRQVRDLAQDLLRIKAHTEKRGG